MWPMSLLLRVLPPIIVGSVPSLSWSHSRSAAASSHHHHLSGCDPRGKCRVPVALTSAKDVGKCGLHSACCQFVSLPVSHSVTLSLCTDDGYLKSQLLLPPSHSLYFTAFTASPRRDLRHLPGFPLWISYLYLFPWLCCSISLTNCWQFVCQHTPRKYPEDIPLNFDWKESSWAKNI